MEDEIVWVSKEFKNLDLKDKSLNKRFINVASGLMSSPTKTINQAMKNWSESKAAYRLFDNKKFDRDLIMSSHKESTIERMNSFSEEEVFIAIQDSTTLNYTHHPKTTGLKKLHRQKDYATSMHGFHLHNLLITTSDGIPLGLLSQDVYHNDAPQVNHKHLPITQKKSFRWIEGLRTTYELSKTGKKIVTVCDRESDI